jgi:adenosylhomocysteine nucleosidase
VETPPGGFFRGLNHRRGDPVLHMAYEAEFVDASLAARLLGEGKDTGRVSSLTLEPPNHTVIVFVGMPFEAKIAAGPGAVVFSRESRHELTAAAENAERRGYRGIISFGVAGGLASDLRPGDWVVASSIVDSQNSCLTDRAWSNKLFDLIGGARYAPIVGVDDPIAKPTTKRELHRTTGAAAVDMESHVVARLAAAHRLAFAAARVIVDPADRAIPPAALVGMNADGRTNVPAILRELIARPSQLSRLARIAIDAFIARSEMQRVRRLLGSHFGLADLAGAELEQAALVATDLPRSDVAAYRSVA